MAVRIRKRQCVIKNCFSVEGTTPNVTLFKLNTKQGKKVMKKLSDQRVPTRVQILKPSHAVCSLHLTTNGPRKRGTRSPIPIGERAEILSVTGMRTPPKERPPLQSTPKKQRTLTEDAPDELQDPSTIQIAELETLVSSLREQLAKSQEDLATAHGSLPFDPSTVLVFRVRLTERDESSRWTGFKNVSALFDAIGPLSFASPRLETKVKESCGLRNLFSYYLVWLRRGMYFDDFPEALGTRTTLSKRFHALTTALTPWARAQVSFPSIAEWSSIDNLMATARSNQTVQASHPNVRFFAVDGSYCQVFEPQRDSVERTTLWQAKHKVHAFCWFILCAMNGRIVYMSNAYEGSIGDKAAWDVRSNVVNQLTESYPAVSFEGLNWKPAICGDKAYPRIQLPGKHWMLYTTKNTESEVDRSCGNRKADPGIAIHRSVAERSIGKIKEWGILSNMALVSNQPFRWLNDLLLVVAALTNYCVFTARGQRQI